MHFHKHIRVGRWVWYRWMSIRSGRHKAGRTNGWSHGRMILLLPWLFLWYVQTEKCHNFVFTAVVGAILTTTHLKIKSIYIETKSQDTKHIRATYAVIYLYVL